jgi:hypothetical protein
MERKNMRVPCWIFGHEYWDTTLEFRPEHCKYNFRLLSCEKCGNIKMKVDERRD